MKNYLRLPVLLLLYILLCSKGCNDRNEIDEQTRLEAETDSIRDLFASDKIAPSMVPGFEQTAIRKLTNLNDYMAIVNDTAAAETFREKARKMIRECFTDEKVFGSFSEKFQKNKLDFGKYPLDSVWISDPLKQVSDSIYLGELSYTFQLEVKSQSNGSSKSLKPGLAEFYAVKRIQHFGSDTLKIWKVFLGNVQ